MLNALSTNCPEASVTRMTKPFVPPHAPADGGVPVIIPVDVLSERPVQAPGPQSAVRIAPGAQDGSSLRSEIIRVGIPVGCGWQRKRRCSNIPASGDMERRIRHQVKKLRARTRVAAGIHVRGCRRIEDGTHYRGREAKAQDPESSPALVVRKCSNQGATVIVRALPIGGYLSSQ